MGPSASLGSSLWPALATTTAESHCPATISATASRRLVFFSSRRRHTRLQGDWSSDVCSSDLCAVVLPGLQGSAQGPQDLGVGEAGHGPAGPSSQLVQGLHASEASEDPKGWVRDRKSVV